MSKSEFKRSLVMRAAQDFETGTGEEVFNSAMKAAVIYYEEWLKRNRYLVKNDVIRHAEEELRDFKKLRGDK